MLTKAGAKLLDFGLARLTGHRERPAVEDLTSAPTVSAPLTGRGTILGTIPYMAPEQLEGKAADARADLWALGAILYEMVAGRRAFDGQSSVSLIAAILEHVPPPLSTLQPVTPPSLDRLVRRCLAKSPEDRWDTAHDVADELRWIAEGGLGPGHTPTATVGKRHRGWIVDGLALAAAALLGGLLGRRLAEPPASRPLAVRSLLGVRPAVEMTAGGVGAVTLTPGGSRTAFAWTPDGRSLVFVGRQNEIQQLYVRALDADEARPLEGTQGAQVPAVSPDGQWVAFWTDGAICRMPLAGGPKNVLVRDVQVPAGLAAGEGGRVFYGADDGAIWSAEPERASTRLTTRLAGEVSHLLPHVLRGGRVLLFTVRHRVWTSGDEEIVAFSIAAGERKSLLRDAADARYLDSGHLVFLRRGVLHAAGFDAARLEVRGAPVPVLGDVAQALTGSHQADVTGAGQFAVASSGALAYLRGGVAPYHDARLVAVDRQGNISPLAAPPRSFAPVLGLSPDGHHLAVPIRGLTEQAVWLHDLERGTLDRLDSGAESAGPRWTLDGQRVIFLRLDNGVSQLAWQRADGTEGPEVLVPGAGQPSSCTPDGQQLAFVKEGDVWLATLQGGSAMVTPLLQTPYFEGWPEFSPDGRWLAYGSNASGREEVYVQPYPGPGARQQVSVAGGRAPAWSRSGQELFFVSEADSRGRRQMMAVDVRSAARLTLGRPRPLFEYSPVELWFACTPARCFAVAPDGQRFYAVQALSRPPPVPVSHVELVLNWSEELKARLAGGTGR